MYQFEHYAHVHAYTYIYIHILAIESVPRYRYTSSSNLEKEWNVLRLLWYTDNIIHYTLLAIIFTRLTNHTPSKK